MFDIVYNDTSWEEIIERAVISSKEDGNINTLDAI